MALPPRVVKRCGCGASYTARQYAGLDTPPSGGRISYPWGEAHVLRNCAACGSTLVRVFSTKRERAPQSHTHAEQVAVETLFAQERLDKFAG